MYKKIIIFSIITLFLMGFVSAQSVSDFKFSGDFKDVGDGVYIKSGSNGQPDQNLAIIPYSQHSIDDYFKNDTDYGYSVNESKNFTFNYIDAPLKEQGSCEVINVSGDAFIVESWEAANTKNAFKDTFNNLLEFNKLNKVKPVNMTAILNNATTNETQ